MKLINVTLVGTLLVLFPTLTVPPLVMAQSTLGSILGTARDASAGVLPGVTVTVRNQATGIARDVITDDHGYYEASHLTYGRYEVAAELNGFKKFVRRDVVVESTVKFRVDLLLEVGGSDQKVEVISAAPIVQSEDGRIGTVYDQKVVFNVPHPSRSGHFSYVALTPGGSLTSQFRYSMNGSRGWSNGYNIDGVATERPTNGDNLSAVRNDRDAIAEVRYDSVNNDAEFGHAATVSTTTRAGTNELHGSFEFTRQNGAWAARNTFSSNPPVLGTQNISVAAGGPILIPKVYDGRQRTFFFVAYLWPENPFSNGLPDQCPDRADAHRKLFAGDGGDPRPAQRPDVRRQHHSGEPPEQCSAQAPGPLLEQDAPELRRLPAVSRAISRTIGRATPRGDL